MMASEHPVFKIIMAAMTRLPAALRASLALPAVAAPMFLVSGHDVGPPVLPRLIQQSMNAYISARVYVCGFALIGPS
jgi:hypothetical protein